MEKNDLNKEVLEASEKINNKLQQLQEELKTVKEKGGTIEQIQSLESKITDASKSFVSVEEFNKIKDSLKETEKEISSLREKNFSTKGGKTLKDIIIENKEKIKDSLQNRTGETTLFTAQKGLFTRASLENDINSYIVPDAGEIAHREITFTDLFPTITIGSGKGGRVTYRDWDEATVDRKAKAIAEGAPFDSSTIKNVTRTLDLVKIGDSIDLTEEVMEDEAQIESELSLFINTNVALVEEEQIYKGNGTAPNMKGLLTYIPEYTVVSRGVTAPNIYDLIRYAKEQIEKDKGSKNKANFIAINPTDLNRAESEKDGNNNYLNPYFRTQTTIYGLNIVVSSLVDENSIVIGDSRYARIYQTKEGYEISKGLKADGFIEDEVTLKARARKALLIKESDKNAFVKISDVDAAITGLL